MRALILPALLAPACGGTYVYRNTLEARARSERPIDCRIFTFEGSPVSGWTGSGGRREGLYATPYGLFEYREVGSIEFRGRRGGDWPTRDLKTFRDWVAPTVCDKGGAAIAVRADADGYYVGAVVLDGPTGGGDGERDIRPTCGTWYAEQKLPHRLAE
jgi:hypothetical protein